ncbi:MAG: hypothetical protein EOL97_07925 [Spirochaetia bacterium]|nr:hypothetical protein [Spirochaetia bacterium]
MRNKRLSLLVLLTTVLLLSSCDVSTLLNTFKGNTYEELFNVNLVGEQAQEAANAVAQASTPQQSSGAVEAGKVKVDQVVSVEQPKGVAAPSDIPTKDATDSHDLENGKVAVVDDKIPTLPKQTEEEKLELKATVANALTGSSEDEFIESLQEAADDAQIIAAHNTVIIMNRLLQDLNANIGSSGMSQEFIDSFNELKEGLILELPQNPTQADILNIQVASNLINSFIAALNLIAGDDDIDNIDVDDVDTDDQSINDSINSVISDAALMVKVAKAKGSTSDIINSVKINELFSLFNNEGGSSVERVVSSPTDETYDLPEESLQYLNAFNDTIDLIIQDILGVDITAAIPTMDRDKFNAAIKNYSDQYAGFNAFIRASKLGKKTRATINGDDRATFCGVTGLINYTIATVLVNVEDVFDTLATDIDDEDYNTIEEIIDAFLAPASNVALIQADTFTTDMSLTLPADLIALEDSFNNPDDIISDLDLETKALNYVKNAIYLVGLGSSDENANILIDMLKELKSSLE